MKKHDESKDLALVSRVAYIDRSSKHIRANKSSVIGIRTLGRIDYLVNHCGWFFRYDNTVSVRNGSKSTSDETVVRKRQAKKNSKEQTLTNKKKK